MKKKITKKSILNNSFAKAIPLSVAIGLLSAGTAFGGTGVVQVDMGEDKIAQFDSVKMSTDPEYAAKMKAALKKAFNSGKSVLVQEADNQWIEFSKNAHDDVTYDKMLQDPTSFVGTAATDPTKY